MAAPDFSRSSPFAPGAGTIPAYVAGRKAERQTIDKAIAAITSKRTKEGTLANSPLAPITMIGPRGVGKTTLLVLAKEKALEQGVLVISIVQMPDLRGIVWRLMNAPRIGWRRFVPRWLDRASNVRETTAGTGLADKPEAKDLELVLRERLQTQPVLLWMDEVMHYDLKSLASVLQISQMMIEERLPLATILAGTPGLEDHLMNADASFLAGSEYLRFNQFKDDESADALRTPLANRGIEVEGAALEMMVSLTDNYPYFVQMIGDEVWDALVEKQQMRVDVALVEMAGKKMLKERDGFYSRGHNELYYFKLLPYARQVLDLMGSFANKRATQEMIEAELMSKNSGLSKNQARIIVQKLKHKDFLWAYEKDSLGPGRPSFYTYMEAKADAYAGARGLMSSNYHDLTGYPSEQVGDEDLQVKIELPLEENCGIVIERKDCCIAGPEGKVFQVNRIEDTRQNPLLERTDFSGYILHLGAQYGSDFNAYGVGDFPPGDHWQNVASAR